MAHRNGPSKGEDCLIVALDLPTPEKALDVVKELERVRFFKIGLHLVFSDMWALISDILKVRGGNVFFDLKLAGDIASTITALINGCVNNNVKFITLSETYVSAVTNHTLEAARAARGQHENPRLLMVPVLSSIDGAELLKTDGTADVTGTIVERGKVLLKRGCDGIVVSGEAILACREQLPPEIDIVSPGIRPAWASTDDHKRITTPAEAIRYGADYLVVGRPILNHPNRQEAVDMIIDEINEALTGGAQAQAQTHPQAQALA